MKWPLVLRKTYDARVKFLQDQVAGEYERATADGNRAVREWAVDANYELYQAEGTGIYQARVRAVMQDAIGKFRPERRSS